MMVLAKTRGRWQASQEPLCQYAHVLHLHTHRQNNTSGTIFQIAVQSNSSMQHYECVVLCKDISLQRGRFCTRSLASCIPRSSKVRSSWMFFIPVVHGRPVGRFQFSGGGLKMAWLASAFSSIRARCPVRRQDLMMDESGGWLVIRRMSGVKAWKANRWFLDNCKSV